MAGFTHAYIESLQHTNLNEKRGRELHDYFTKTLNWKKSYPSQEVFKLLMSAAAFTKQRVILDAGAGHKRYQPFFRDAIYLTQEFTAGIKLKKMTSVDYDFINPLDKKIPLKNNSIDAILLTSVLEHIANPAIFFSEAYRVLRKGGKIFIQTPFIYNEHEVPYDFNRFTRYGINKLLKDSRFDHIDIKPISSCIYSVAYLLPLAIVYDLLMTDQDPDKIFNELLIKRKLRGFKKTLLVIVSFICYIFAKLLGKILIILFDRSPYKEATISIGWIALAQKPGILGAPKKYKNKKDFLLKNRLK